MTVFVTHHGIFINQASYGMWLCCSLKLPSIEFIAVFNFVGFIDYIVQPKLVFCCGSYLASAPGQM